MAVIITKIDVATPTNLTATAQAGGALDAGITYYYRIISYRWYGNRQSVFSAVSAEVSATTDATNKQIALTWDAMANASGYIIQRTTTSGSYPLDGNNSLKRAAQAYGSIPCAVNTNNFTDDNNGLYTWTAKNQDFSQEVIVIDASSDAGETITMEDIYDADVAGSWGAVNMLVPTGLQGLSNSTLKQNAPYYILGGLYIHDCVFQLPQLLYTFIGTVYFASTVTLNNVSASYPPNVFQISNFIQPIAPPDMSSILYRANQASLKVSGGTLTGLVRRSLNLVIQGGLYSFNVYDNGVGGATFNRCLIGLGSGNQIPVYDGIYTNTIFEGLRLNAPLVNDAILFSGDLSIRWMSAIKIDGVTVTSGAGYDFEMGSQHSIMVVNPVFGATTTSTNSNPYIYEIVFASSDGHGICIANDLKLTVVDNNGNPISGATITITDVNGANALWEDSTATLNEDLDNTETDITVSDSSVVSVNDYIRFDLNAEIMKVTAIPNGTTLTVERGALGSKAEFHSDGNTNKMLRNVASLTTDANGIAEADYPMISRYLEVIYQGGYKYDYEDNLVANNYLGRYLYSPHTVTIKKSGYRTRTIKYTMDRKREEIEKLEKVKDFNFSRRGKILTQ